MADLKIKADEMTEAVAVETEGTQKKTARKPRTVPVSRKRTPKKAAGIKAKKEQTDSGTGRVASGIEPKKADVIQSKTHPGVMITTYLTPDEKLSVAGKVLDRVIYVDDKTHTAFKTVFHQKEISLALVEAYTNIEVPENERHEWCDAFIDNEIYNEIIDATSCDWTETRGVCEEFADIVVNQQNYMQSIDYFMRQLSDGTNYGEQILDMIQDRATEVGETAEKLEQVAAKQRRSPLGLGGEFDDNSGKLISFAKKELTTPSKK